MISPAQDSKIVNTTGLPEPVAEAVRRFSSKYSRGDDVDISITQLSKPPRMVALEELHRHEIVTEAEDNLWMLYGSIVHEILQSGYREYGMETERRYFTSVNTWKISGQVDVFYPAIGKLSDYKFCSAWEAKKQEPKPEWVEQLNCYAELLRRNDREVKTLTAVRLFRDWSKQEARRDPDYPQKSWSEIEIPDWGREKASEWLLNRVQAHQEARERLPLCSAEERWNAGDKWAVIKAGASRATKLHDSEESASNHAQNAGKGYSVEVRKGESKRCLLFCQVSQFCDQWKLESAGSKSA